MRFPGLATANVSIPVLLELAKQMKVEDSDPSQPTPVKLVGIEVPNAGIAPRTANRQSTEANVFMCDHPFKNALHCTSELGCLIALPRKSEKKS